MSQTISPEVKDDNKPDTFNSAVQMEVQKMAPNDPSKANDLKPAVSDAMMKIVDRAKSMAEKQTQSAAETEASKQVLKQEFQQLLNVMFIPSLVDKDDIKKLKDAGGCMAGSRCCCTWRIQAVQGSSNLLCLWCAGRQLAAHAGQPHAAADMFLACTAGVFGPQTFWVTEMRLVEEKDKMGILVRGNLRDDRDELFKWVDLWGG